MSERYEKLFSLPADLYAAGSPVVVSAGNLLKDNQTGRVLVQLKIKNVSIKTVKAATVIVHALDTAGLPLDGDAEKEYLDFSAAPGAEFGQKAAIPLPRDTTRGFTASISKAVFADNSVWTGADAPWEPLPPAAKINDPELSKQLQLTFGGPCGYLPQEHKDLWRCACGAWNKGETCYACGKDKAAMLSLDLAALNEEKNERVAQEKAAREVREAADGAAAEAQAKKTKKLLSILLPVAAVCLAAILLVTKVVVPNSNYKTAKALMDGGQYEEAIAAFEALDGYKDSEKQIATAKAAKAEQERLAAEAKAEQERLAREAQIEADYAAAVALYNAGDYMDAIAAFEVLGDYKNSAEYINEFWDHNSVRNIVAAGRTHTVGLRTDGTVAVTQFTGGQQYYFGQCDVQEWKDIVSVAAGWYHTVGLKEDGTVVAVGSNDRGQCNVSGWKDIVAIAADANHTVGLKEDGTVVAVGYNAMEQCNVSGWKDIIAIATSQFYTMGLTIDGTVLVTRSIEERDASGWTDIVAIGASDYSIVGLKADGTVVAAGGSTRGACDVSGWTNIVAIAAGYDHTVGLKTDGTVMSVGYNGNGQCNVSDWTDIVAIAAGWDNTIGLKADGTVIAAGEQRVGKNKVSDWTDIRVPEK